MVAVDRRRGASGPPPELAAHAAAVAPRPTGPESLNEKAWRGVDKVLGGSGAAMRRGNKVLRAQAQLRGGTRRCSAAVELLQKGCCSREAEKKQLNWSNGD